VNQIGIPRWFRDASRPIIEFVAFAGGLTGIYQFLGIRASVIGVIAILIYYTVQRCRHLSRATRARSSLLAELPNHHAFLVEFLRETYSLPRDEVLISRNEGAFVLEYENSFVVHGTDCENHQRIVGKSIADRPLRGVAFPLVGGSSVSASDLHATYKVGDAREREPEFIQDRDRFKIAYCEFPSAVAPRGEFTLVYRDNWRASMRAGADGFFFPETLCFPSGVQRLVMKVGFAFEVASIALLEVNMNSGSVKTCREQPSIHTPGVELKAEYRCTIDRPDPDTVYVLYYVEGDADGGVIGSPAIRTAASSEHATQGVA